MKPIEAALAAIPALKPGAEVNYTKLPKSFSAERTMLTRRHQGDFNLGQHNTKAEKSAGGGASTPPIDCMGDGAQPGGRSHPCPPLYGNCFRAKLRASADQIAALLILVGDSHEVDLLRISERLGWSEPHLLPPTYKVSRGISTGLSIVVVLLFGAGHRICIWPCSILPSPVSKNRCLGQNRLSHISFTLNRGNGRNFRISNGCERG